MASYRASRARRRFGEGRGRALRRSVVELDHQARQPVADAARAERAAGVRDARALGAAGAGCKQLQGCA
eukprot:6034872-Prymnesium_polylepis.1